jgi:TolB-like protein/Tfp pilus assembly protein PilF
LANEPELGGDPSARGSQRAVFLSYASEDADAAQRICATLRAAGVEVWFDQSELRGGDAWDATIRKQIKSCTLFIPVISANAHARIEGYFRLEWKLAVDRSHLIAPDQAFLLPVVIDGTPQTDERIPDRFRELQWTRLADGNTPPAFVERIALLLSPKTPQLQAVSRPAPDREATGAARIGAGVGSRGPGSFGPSRKARVLIAGTILVAAGGIALYALSKHANDAHGTATSGGVSEKSIAVLPFENLSDDKANAYFAAGMQEEILSRLAGVGDLKVISRTSTEKYKSRPDNLKTVATELGVATVLEGSVQKSGGKVRVNVQLIDAGRDMHLWASIYDRDLKDVFAVESEISQSIVDALKAKLSPRETRALSALPTRNSEAYDAFLKGEYELAQARKAQTGAHYDSADDYYRQALKLDPDFALAYAKLAVARMNRHWFIKALTPDELTEVKSAAGRALELRQDQAEAHEALGLFHYWGYRDYESALIEFNKALALQPNNAGVRLDRAAIYRRKGDWTNSLQEFEGAVELAPRDANTAAEYGTTLVVMRRFADADRVLTHALALDPAVMQAVRYLGTNAVNGYGDLSRARRILDAAPPGLIPQAAHGAVDVGIIDQRIYLDVLERRFAAALDAWRKIPTSDDKAIRQLFGPITVRIIAGQRPQAQTDCLNLRELLEREQVQDVDKPMRAMEQSWVELCLGHSDAAIRLAHSATELLPLSRDAYYATFYIAGLAQINAQAGHPEEAIALLEQLLSIPAGQTVSIERLKLDPVWDPLRKDPRFQALLSDGHSARVATP